MKELLEDINIEIPGDHLITILNKPCFMKKLFQVFNLRFGFF